MTKKHALSLTSALLINLNIMIGTGIFINTAALSKFAGFLGFVSYLIIMVCILPLIACLIGLIKKYPSGSFYIYATKNYNSLAGFLAAWAYFTGKLGSAALLVHVFSLLMQTLVPCLSSVNIICMDAAIIAFFCWLNTLDRKSVV